MLTWCSQILLGLALSSLTHALDEDVRLISGLRERRLFDLAEQYNRRLMTLPNRTPTQVATDSIELIKTRTARALLANGTDRDQAWSSIEVALTEFQKQHPDHPRRILVTIQAALAHLARGQQLRQELAAEMATDSDRMIALEELRLADSQLTDIQLEIQKQIPLQRNRKLTKHELTGEELQKLNNQIRLQLAIANLNRAQLFERQDRQNRTAVLTNVVERLKEIQRETQPHQPIWWEANALQIECFRLLNKFSEATAFTRMVDELGAEQPNLALNRWLEQQLLLALDIADEQASIKHLQSAEQIPAREPELDLARLATAVDFSLRDIKPGKVEWLNRSAQLARGIEAQHGSYWGRRAKLVLIKGGSGSVESAPHHPNGTPLTDTQAAASSAEVDLLISLAEQAERQNRPDDALKAYDRAAVSAFSLQAAAQGFALAVKAAQVLEKQSKHREAAERFIKLANDHSNYSLASAAHIRGCWNWSRLLSKGGNQQPANSANSPSQSKIRERYLDLLNQHLQSWPQAESANQVRVWLGAEYQARATADGWKQAFQQFSDVRPGSSLFGTAIQQAGYSGRQWVVTSPVSEQKTLAAQIQNRLQTILESCILDSASHQQTLLVATDLGLRFGINPSTEMAEPLRKMLDSDQDVDPLRRQQAAARLYAIDAFAHNADESLANLLTIFSSEKKWLATADQAIAQIIANESPQKSVSVARARMRLAELALDRFGPQLNREERIAWSYRQAEALIELGNTTPAMKILEGLEQELPSDAGIKLRIARILTATESDPEVPLQKWRRLAAQLKPNTDSWFEAKYHVALLLDKAGEKTEAKKMLEYMQAVPPGWENSLFRDEFNQLLQRVR
jgi:hypothetical protein